MSAVGKATRHEEPASTRLFLTVVASGDFVTVLTGSMVNVVIPLMRTEFETSAAQVGWVFTGYALAYAIEVPLYGRISDFFGVRRAFSFGLLDLPRAALPARLPQTSRYWSLGGSRRGSGERRYRARERRGGEGAAGRREQTWHPFFATRCLKRLIT